MLFLPRQVALASASASAAAAAASMAKDESKKEKKSKSKSKAAAKGSSPAAAVPDANRDAVVAAVAAFLESGGYPCTLAALQSEANLEADSWRSSPVSLEELVSKFLDSSNSAPGAAINGSIEQEKTAGGVVEDGGKKKKKKGGDKEVSEAENKAAEPSAVEKTSENVDVETKEKKQKKKKSKEQENNEDVEARLEKAESAIINKFEAMETSKEDSKNALVDGAPVEKGKKKKKGKSTSETSDKIYSGATAAGADAAKGKSDAVETEKGGDEKKSKKKLKKSKENNQVVENKEVAGNKNGMEIDKGENGMPPSDNGVVGKKRKLEEVEGNNTPTKEDNTANQKLSNGSSEDDTKPNKRQKKSSEPKTVNAFQRVKLEDVKFADERLQDNSYWAKGGADSGYGAKAQEVLGQVRGRGFRHEKTKKKRGTYRGGQIDLQTHSIKFNDSDD